MNSNDVDFFKELLTQQLNELLSNAEKTVGTMVHDGEWAADPVDQASMETDRAYTLRIRDRESHLIKKINAALTKIEEGSFGICENCGEEISLARLKVRPVASHCIQCKTKMEAFEKVSGPEA
ncbi:MAG: RNA polymerase-binding protein DksA [Desulfobacteraceae bacterium]|nr:RNA polymerase-binding protein DksA [Desulfobacteraceae bacterium]